MLSRQPREIVASAKLSKKTTAPYGDETRMLKRKT